ncbi:hypothetical protein [Cellulomonas shaoxiangyii]|uniref:Phosphohydrolase n=1 Tax=Cellulomonas shaoxiangyii TaxID=2566013 RepID=A0A4P7SMC7_9CELL|nr:hypothetical protein [Cellulomonas shaoxiangyii]QCB94004.1 hypothetical protein E5225_10930 [Cellulomonas shaoxiangyii]TGY80407.1 hypothetical protein E5226_14945 [Cellulomonas shaoxiangyii]
MTPAAPGATGAVPAAVVPGARRDGPGLETLLHRLAQTPAELFDDAVAAPAVVADLAVALDGTVLDPARLGVLDGALVDRDRAVPALLACWLVADPAVRADPGTRAAAADAGGAALWLYAVATVLPDALAGLRAGAAWLADDLAREELVRAFLAVAGLRAAGEDDALALDAWVAVSTVHRRRMAAETAQEQRRARELAARLAAERAKEAAAQYANY